MKVKVTNIDWDISGYEGTKPQLPKSAIIDIPESVVGEFVVDAVSNKFGWCINSCNYEVISEGKAAAPRPSRRRKKEK